MLNCYLCNQEIVSVDELTKAEVDDVPEFFHVGCYEEMRDEDDTYGEYLERVYA